MPSDRPAGPTPDQPTPDPAESQRTPRDPATAPYEHHPLPPYPEDDPTPPPSSGSSEPTVRFAAGPETTPGSPESAVGGYQPTLPLPADFGQGPGDEPHAPHHLAGESHGGAGPFGEPVEPATPTPTPTPTPGEATMPMPGEAGFVLAGPSPYPAEPPPGLVDVPPIRSPRRGRMTTQEEGVTQPRPPTVAETRAREKARRRAEEQERAEAEAAEAKRRKKKRVLIGGAAVVGIAGLVGGGYLIANAWNGPEVTAMCTVVAKKGEVVPTGSGQTVTATQDNQEIVVPDNYCSDASDHGNSGINPGFFFLAGHSYRYYYGGTGSIGHAPSGGSISAPSGATVKTKSGSTIQRGGLGAKVHGKGGS